MQPNRKRTYVLVAVYFLAASFISSSAPSGLAPSAPVLDPLDTNDLNLFAELSDWVGADDEQSDAPSSARESIRERSTSFEVFRSFHGPDASYPKLQELPYGSEIRSVAEELGVDGFLLAAVIEAESSFNAEAISIRGAVGLMQVMPTTADQPIEALHRPEVNLRHGAGYLKTLLERYSGDLELALAAYNAGPSNVRRYGGVPPFRETRNYVEKVLSLYIDHHRGVWESSDDRAFLVAG